LLLKIGIVGANVKEYEHGLPDVKHGGGKGSATQVNGGKPGGIVLPVTAGEPTFSPGSLNQVTLKFRVLVLPTVTFPKSRMVPLAGVNDTALAGETVRGSMPPMLRHRTHPATSAALRFDFIVNPSVTTTAPV